MDHVYGIAYPNAAMPEKAVFHLVRAGGRPLAGVLHEVLHYLGAVLEFDPGPPDSFVALAQVECFMPLAEAVKPWNPPVFNKTTNWPMRALSKAVLAVFGLPLLVVNRLTCPRSWLALEIFRFLSWEGTFVRNYTVPSNPVTLNFTIPNDSGHDYKGG